MSTQESLRTPRGQSQRGRMEVITHVQRRRRYSDRDREWAGAGAKRCADCYDCGARAAVEDVSQPNT